MMSGIVWIGCLLSVSAWARPAEVAIVGAHLPGQTDEQAQQLAASLEEQIGQLDNLTPISPGQIRGRLSGREPLVVEGVFLGPGRNALEEGRVLYQRADFQSAAQSLEIAVDSLRTGLAGAGESKDLIDALLLLGLAQAALGAEDQAREAFRQVVVFEPQRQLDRINFPPKMVTLFNEVRAATLAQPRRTLTLVTNDNTRIWFDGRAQERTGRTVKLEGVLPGTHTVLVQDDEGQRFFEEVTLNTEDVTLRVGEATRLIAPRAEDENDRSLQIEQLYRSLGDYAETDMILIAGQLNDETVGVQLYEPRTGNFSRVAEERILNRPPVEALQIALLNLNTFVNDGTLRVEFVSLGAPPLNINDNPVLSSMLLDPEPIVEKIVERRTPWYFWAGVGVVAAGGGTAAALLLNPPADTTGTVIVNLPE